MIRNFFKKAKDKVVNTMLDKQLKKLPPEQREQIKTAFMSNPELFQKIAKEIEDMKKKGVNEMHASMQVMQKYKDELQKALGSSQSPQQ